MLLRAEKSDDDFKPNLYNSGWLQADLKDLKHCLAGYKTEKRMKIIFNQTWY